MNDQDNRRRVVIIGGGFAGLFAARGLRRAPVDVTPVHPYARGSWGPKEADRLLPDRDAWHDPAG